VDKNDIRVDDFSIISISRLDPSFFPPIRCDVILYEYFNFDNKLPIHIRLNDKNKEIGRDHYPCKGI